MADEAEIVHLTEELTEVLAPLTDSITTLTELCRVEAERVTQLAAGQSQSVAALATQMDQLSKEMEGLSADVAAKVTPILQTQMVIEAATAEAEDATAPLIGVADDLSEHMDTALSTIQDGMDGFLQSQREVMEAALVEAGNELEVVIAETLIAQIHEAFEDLAQYIARHVETQLEPLTSRVATSVEEIIEGVVHDLEHGSEQTKHENAVVERAVDAIRPAVDHLLSEFKRVTALASMVGM
jgi:hypothetical protein